MIPYIAVLVVIIVAALFATYKKVDPFRVTGSNEYSPYTYNKNTSVGTLAWNYQTILNMLKDQKENYGKLVVLGKPTPGETAILLEENTPGSALTLEYIRNYIADGIKNTEMFLEIIKKSPSDKTLSEAIYLEYPNMSATEVDKKINETLKEFNTNEQVFANISKALNSLYKRSSKSPGAAPGSASGTANTSTVGLSGSTQGSGASTAASTQTMGTDDMVSIGDLVGALAPLNKAYDTSQDTSKFLNISHKTAKYDSDKDKAPVTTAEYNKEVEERIKKSVLKQVKDDLMAKRATENVDTNCPFAQYDSDSTQQGYEYVQGKPSLQPDMSEYIRKDSIPCWGCTIPPQR